MDANETPKLLASETSGKAVTEIPIEQLVVEVYESAPPDLRGHMLSQLIGRVYEAAPPGIRGSLVEYLLQPLSMLSLVTVAHGIFAKVWFRSKWQHLPNAFGDAQDVQTGDVVALADYVQQVSVDAVNGLAQILAASPMMTVSAAAAVLVTVLMKRSRRRRVGDK